MAELDESLTNIIVSVRIRPLSKREIEHNDVKTVYATDSNTLILIDPQATSKRPREKYYKFDRVFDDMSSQVNIFEEMSEQLVINVLDGYNATIFAYGPTGAGKTYTMFGEGEKIGFIPLSFFDIFEKISSFSDRKYTIQVSYLEIYNENLRDLLTQNSVGLDIREDPQKGIMISDLTEAEAKSAEQIIEVIRQGNRKRTVEPTEVNSASSRSHGIILINIDYIDRFAGIEGEIFSSKFILVDLAGSERAAYTKNKGQRLIEGANINRSLLALGNCINSLYELNKQGSKGYVPYRDSKLTRILKDSLGGKCKTVMISCVSPFSLYFEDTHNTLEYSSRAKNIKNKLEKNVVSVDYHVIKYKEIINELKGELKGLKQQLGRGVDLKSETNNDRYLKELEGHFKEEKRLKNLSFELVQEIDSFNEEILAKQDKPEDVKKLRQKIKAGEEKLKKMNFEYAVLERKRSDFEVRWNDLPEDFYVFLKINLQKHIIQMHELDIGHKKAHEENLVKNKDLYIAMLEDKLKNRISGLEKQIFSDKESAFSRGKDSEESPTVNKRTKNYLEVKRAIDGALKNELLLPLINQGEKGQRFLSKETKIKRLKKKNINVSSSDSSFGENLSMGVKGISKGKSHISNIKFEPKNRYV